MDEDFYYKISFLQKVQSKNDLPMDVSIKAVNHMPIHMHDCLELVYVIEGNVKIKISYDCFELKAGDFLLINIFEVHEIEKISDENAILFLHLDKNVLGQKICLFAFDPLFYRNYNKLQVELMKKLMIQVYLYNGGNDCKDKIIAIIDEIIFICLKYFEMQSFDAINKTESPFKSSTVNLERIGNTFRYFYEDFHHKIQLKEIAKREYIDKYYVSHLIKTGTGTTFQEVLNMVRIDRAEVLLLGTKMSIQEIVTAIGFSSYQYFNQQFKLYYGMTPFAYRKTYEKKAFPMMDMKFDCLPKKEEELKNLLVEQFQLSEEVPSKSLLLKNVNKKEIFRILCEFGFQKELMDLDSGDVKRIVLELS